MKRDVLAAVEAGKYALPRMSKAQIKELLYDLPCPEPGKVSFHDLQRLVNVGAVVSPRDMECHSRYQGCVEGKNKEERRHEANVPQPNQLGGRTRAVH